MPIQKHDLKVVSWRQAPSTAGSVITEMGHVPNNQRRYVYMLKVGAVGATQVQTEVNQRCSATTNSDWRRDFTLCPGNAAPVVVPTHVDLESPVLVFDENTYFHARCSAAEADFTVLYADGE